MTHSLLQVKGDLVQRPLQVTVLAVSYLHLSPALTELVVKAGELFVLGLSRLEQLLALLEGPHPHTTHINHSSVSDILSTCTTLGVRRVKKANILCLETGRQFVALLLPVVWTRQLAGRRTER